MIASATKYCHACAASIDSRAEICPKCGVRQPMSFVGGDRYSSAVPIDPVIRDAASKKLAAGILGIFFGWLGIHKFVLGMTTPGIIMAVVTICTCGYGGIVMWTIGFIEGVIYLTKSDDDFYETYVVEKKPWF